MVIRRIKDRMLQCGFLNVGRERGKGNCESESGMARRLIKKLYIVCSLVCSAALGRQLPQRKTMKIGQCNPRGVRVIELWVQMHALLCCALKNVFLPKLDAVGHYFKISSSFPRRNAPSPRDHALIVRFKSSQHAVLKQPKWRLHSPCLPSRHLYIALARCVLFCN